jgi:membrane protein DedA with SNARE-associated domain
VLAQLLDKLLDLPGPAVYLVLAGLAAAENVFPPVPADSAVALGAVLSVGGNVSPWGVFLVAWSANVTSAALVYAAARTVGRAFFRGPLGRRLVRREALARIERLYDRHGTWAIFVSRFIPGVRAVVPAFAGVANLDAARALLPVVVASALWYGALTFVAATFIQNVDAVGELLSRFRRLALVAGVAAVTAGAGIVLLWRRARQAAE